MNRHLLSFLLAALVAGCGDGNTPGSTDTATDVQVSLDGLSDAAVPEDGIVFDDSLAAPDEDNSIPDPGPADEGPADPGQPDPGPPDLGMEDPGAVDPGFIDPGPPPDPGPGYSELVASCLYVVENICAKAIKKCDFLDLIPSEWMEVCTDFLINQESIILGGCGLLEDAQFSSPEGELIKTFGPPALKECIDNFECTLENILKLGEFITPLIQGEEFETADILALVADLCFK